MRWSRDSGNLGDKAAGLSSGLTLILLACSSRCVLQVHRGKLRLSLPFHTTTTMNSGDPEREHALQEYKSKLLESREWEAKLKALRLEIKGLQRDYDVSEENIKALQSVGQIIGEVLKQLDDERC